MRYRAQFIAQVQSVNAYGERALTYPGTPYYTCWARRIRNAQNEGLQDNRLEGTITETFEIRYDSRVVLTDKVLIGSAAYNITGIDDTYKHKGKLTITLRRNV